MIFFEPLNSDGHKRSMDYHAARLSMLHDRVVKRIGQVDRFADEVERAAAVLVHVTQGSAVDVSSRAAVFDSSSAAHQLERGQTLGL